MAATSASNTVVGVFAELGDAEEAIRELQNHGFSRDGISVIANRTASEYRESESGKAGNNYPDIKSEAADAEPATDKTSHIAADAGVGAALGGLGGLLLGFAGLAIPGIGPIVAAGPIVAGLTGLGIGAAAGGVVGALTEAGVPKEEAHAYAEGVRRGDILVTVKASDETQSELAREILDRYKTVDVVDRTSAWRARGWQGHNPGAEPLSADEIRREREYYRLAGEQGQEWDNLTGREVAGADPALQGETRWPHPIAHDQSESLQKKEVLDVERAPDLAGQDRDFKNSNPDFGATIDNNRHVVDPAVVRAESGFQRAMESASRSARRRARIYGR